MVKRTFARGAQHHHVLSPLDKCEAGELEKLLARRAGGEAEVVALERLDRREAGDAGCHLSSTHPPGIGLGPQHVLEEVAERALLRGLSLRSRGPCRVDDLHPKLGAKVRDAFVLEAVHRPAPGSISSS